MINVSELFKQVANRDSRTFRAKAIINDIEYKEFREVKITQSCESNTSLSFGSTSSACLNVTIVDVDKGVILTGQKIKLFIGLKTNDSLDMFDDDSAYTYIQVGEFNVDTPSWEDSDVKITAYDHFYLCEQGFFTNLSGMQKVKNIVSEQCTKLGIEFVDDIEDVSYNVDVLKGLTIREAFGYLASFLGKNARFDNLGKLQFVWYTDSQLTIDSDRFSSPLTIGNAYAIGSLSCIVRTTTTNDDGVTQNEDTTYTSGSGEGISFSNLYMTQERLNTLLSRIKNFSIRSAQLNWNMALPQITVGDIINVKDVDNTIYVIPIMEYTIDIDGGCYGTVKSKFVSQTEQSKEFKGSLSQQVERIYTDYGSFKEIITEKITAFNGEFVQINADFVNVNQKLTALEAKIGNLDVTELSARVATIEEAYISKAQVEQLYATKAEIGTISANVAEIQEAMIGVAYVDDLNALEAKINEIEAGSVTTDYLETNYAKIDLSNIENGCITTAMIGTGVVGTAQIADGSITDAKIVGLTANKLTAGTIDASDIEVINLNCANLTVGTINGQQIANNAIDWDKLNSQVSGTINNANTNANQALEDALEAMQEAQSAANAAQSAQTTANGKNTVIYATAQPSTSGRKTNDIWFDTDDGNKMYYFNGTSWVAAQFGTNAIKSASITNALIADAAINNAKISNLDAGKITSGYLSSDRIQAGSLAIGKLDNGTQTKINDAFNTANNVVLTTAMASGKMLFKDPSFASGNNSINIYNNENNGTVTVTRIQRPSDSPITSSAYVLEIKNTGTSSPACGGFMWAHGSRANAIFIYKIIAKLPNKRKLQWASNQVGTGQNQKWISNPEGDGNSYKEYICYLKCGYTGNFSSTGFFALTGAVGSVSNPVTWYVAYATCFDCTNVNLDYNSIIANWCYNNDTTYINGGKIYTGTVTASQIAANAIVAGKIAANAVTTSTIAADAVNADKIAAKSINAEHINGAIITGDMIVASTITGAKIAAKTITANNIAADTITAAQIASGTITSTEINVGSVKAAILTANSITSTMIAANAITSDKISANAITSAKIATDAIKSRNYVANSTGSYLNLQDGSFTSKNLKWTADGTLTGTNVNLTGTITASSGTIGGFKIGTNSIRGGTQSNEPNGTLALVATTSGTVFAAGPPTGRTITIDATGKLTATNATIKGTISASTISGSTISGGTISGASITGGSITSNTSINVTTDLKVGKNIYLDQNTPNTIKTIQFNGNNYIQNINLSSNNSYIKMQSNYRAALMASGGSGASVAVTGSAYGSVTIEMSAQNGIYANSTIITKNDASIRAKKTNGSLTNLIGVSSSNNIYIGDAGDSSATVSTEDTNIYAGYMITLAPNRQYSNATNANYFRETSGAYRTIFRPASNGGAYLGTSSYRWNTAFFSNAITNSDLKEKQIIDRDMKSRELIMSLKPISYKRIGEGDTGNRIHMGLGAQTVYNSIKTLGLGDLSITQASIIDGENERPYYGEDIDDSKLSWGLNYTELFAPMIDVLQIHDRELQDLRNENTRLKQELKNTQDKLDAFINGNYQIREVAA